MFEPPPTSTTRRKKVLLVVLGVPLALAMAALAFMALLAVDHSLHPGLERQPAPNRRVP